MGTITKTQSQLPTQTNPNISSTPYDERRPKESWGPTRTSRDEPRGGSYPAVT